jgi:hypothetical protein
VLPGHSSGSASLDQQLAADVATTLTDRGMVATDRDEAQAVVVVHAATASEHSRAALYQGWGGWAWRLNAVAATDGGETYEPGTLVVDIFDAWTQLRRGR